MTQRNNILQELVELQSSLGSLGTQNIYTVPVGYFDNLANEVLNRIKALDCEDVSEELEYLSPLLNGISRQMPFSVPANFFNEQDERIVEVVKGHNEETAAEELRTISPLLSGLKKEMPFSVPQGYFEGLESARPVEEIKPATKVVSITKQKWFRYAAAAAVAGFIAAGSFMYLGKKQTIDPKTQSSEWVEKSMKKVSTNDINNFVQLTDEETPVIASIETKTDTKDKNDIQELIKDIPDKDIQSFLDDTGADNPENNDDALMN